MIKSLFIKNFILIDELFLEFEQGFNVLIGETGAGKSIIIKAIDAVLGARIQKDVIKDVQKNALIEITFENVKNLNEFELAGEITISREIGVNSQKCRVNGALVNLDYIKELREKLLDIHSQHQSYSYVSPKSHIGLLNSYCVSNEPEFLNILNEYQQNFKNFQSTTKKLEQMKANNSNNAREVEFLKFQINEIDSAQIFEGEEEQINSEIEKLSNIQSLKEATYGAHYALSQDDSILEALSKIKFSISNARSFDNSLEEVENAFIEGFENLKYCSDFLRDYSENLEDNPMRLNELNERLSLILKLKRKYGDIFVVRQELQKQLDLIEGDCTSLEELERLQKQYFVQIEKLSQIISKKRKEVAPQLASLIENELKLLELEKAHFEIKIENTDFNLNGTDDVEFLITTNVSSALAPLSKVASGGEISRIVLAIKTIFANADEISTIILDEIDTGISGKASNAVANSICKLSNDIQVFAITHQPIIASRANAYFKVEKIQQDETKIVVKKLTVENDRLQALASLASGEISFSSVSFAKDLLNGAQQLSLNINQK